MISANRQRLLTRRPPHVMQVRVYQPEVTHIAVAKSYDALIVYIEFQILDYKILGFFNPEQGLPFGGPGVVGSPDLIDCLKPSIVADAFDCNIILAAEP